MHKLLHTLLYLLNMAIIRNFIDPNGTKHPNKNPILVSIYMFKLVIVIERLLKICFPSTCYGGRGRPAQ